MPETLVEPDWPAPAGVRAYATTRLSPGVSPAPWARCNLGLNSGEDSGVVRRNRAMLGELLALPSAPCWLRQVHGREVVRVGREPPGEEPAADASVTVAAGQVLAVLVADCLPVLVCADDGSEVGAAHAGWRGLAGGVLEATVAAMNAPPAHLMAWLGPCIGPASFEVGAEVRAAFVNADADAADAFTAGRRGHWYGDLAMLARQRLAAVGVSAVHGGGFDTMIDPRFYSFRRDGAHSGRFAALIWRASTA